MSEMGMAMMGTGAATGEGRAREAAEAAIASPLLEDVNLSGAKGILVNITAGMDLEIGEFEEVGNTVKEFASEDATVVVGTVIEADMSDELRVTVVATGLGGNSEAVSQEEKRIRLVQSKEGAIDYGALDESPALRNQAVADKPVAGMPQESGIEYLDIPAFLRRQAD
jgi:cell division protein FtsZ